MEKYTGNMLLKHKCLLTYIWESKDHKLIGFKLKTQELIELAFNLKSSNIMNEHVSK